MPIRECFDLRPFSRRTTIHSRYCLQICSKAENVIETACISVFIHHDPRRQSAHVICFARHAAGSVTRHALTLPEPARDAASFHAAAGAAAFRRRHYDYRREYAPDAAAIYVRRMPPLTWPMPRLPRFSDCPAAAATLSPIIAHAATPRLYVSARRHFPFCRLVFLSSAASLPRRRSRLLPSACRIASDTMFSRRRCRRRRHRKNAARRSFDAEIRRRAIEACSITFYAA